MFGPLTNPNYKTTIPAELRALKKFVVWRYHFAEQRQRWTKPPYNPVSGRNARTNDVRDWTNFDYALNVAMNPENGWDGVGYVLTHDDPYMGLDLDHCIEWVDGQPMLSQFARDVIEITKWSYTEISPSGTGIRIFCRGLWAPDDLPADKFLTGGGRKNSELGLEVYDRGRYLTLTGAAIFQDVAIGTLDEYQIGTLRQFFDEEAKSKSIYGGMLTREAGAPPVPEELPSTPDFGDDARTQLPIRRGPIAPPHVALPMLDGRQSYCPDCSGPVMLSTPMFGDTPVTCSTCLLSFFGNDFLENTDDEALIVQPTAVASITGDQEVDQLLHAASLASNGNRILQLFNGDLSTLPSNLHHTDGRPDMSRVDQYFCTMCAFYTANRPDLLDRLFRRSKLYRAKWDAMHGAQTYGQMTIAKAQQSVAKTAGLPGAPKVVLEAPPNPHQLDATQLTVIQEFQSQFPPVNALGDSIEVTQLLAQRKAQADAELAARIEQQQRQEQVPAPRPIAMRGVIVPPPPLDAFPAWIREICQARQYCARGPIDFALFTALGAVSGAYTSRQMVAAQNDHVEPGLLWTMMIGSPSTKKGPMMRPFMELVKKRGADICEARNKEIKTHRQAILAKRDEVKRAANERDRMQRQLDSLPVSLSLQDRLAKQAELSNALHSLEGRLGRLRTEAEDEGPMQRLEGIENFTKEALILGFRGNEPIFCMSEEAAFLTSACRTYGTDGPDDALILTSYDGGSHTMHRKTGGGVDGADPQAIILESVRLSVVSTAQPNILLKFNRDNALTDSGLLQRFCPIYPQYDEPATRPPATPPTYQTKLDAYNSCIDMLFGAARKQPVAQTHVFDPYALDLFQEYQGQIVAQKQEVHTGLGEGWLGKQAGRVMRMALILHIADSAPEMGHRRSRWSSHARQSNVQS